jgi:hypothetical protein
MSSRIPPVFPAQCDKPALVEDAPLAFLPVVSSAVPGS